MKLGRSDIQKIAYTSRLELTKDEIGDYKDNLNEALDYFSKIKNVDTTNVSPMRTITDKNNVFRDDKLKMQDEDNEKLYITNTKDGYYVVPAIIDDGQ